MWAAFGELCLDHEQLFPNLVKEGLPTIRPERQASMTSGGCPITTTAPSVILARGVSVFGIYCPLQ
jgi:hypothetical protein